MLDEGLLEEVLFRELCLEPSKKYVMLLKQRLQQHVRFVEPEQGDLFEGMLKRNGVAATAAPELEAPPAASSQQLAAPGSSAAKHHAADALRDIVDLGDAPSCHVCGSIMTRNGSCYRCMSCGSTSGCS